MASLLGAIMRNKIIPFLSAAAGFILLLRAAVPAHAGPADCEAISNSFNAIANAQGYRQVVEMTTPPMTMQQIVIGETIYTQVDGKWMKLRMKPGGRKGMLDAIMSMSSVSDCKEIRAETLPAGRMKVYEFMMTPPKGIPGAGDQPLRQEVWIGVADGLVHRMTAPQTKVELSFDKIVAPIP